MYQFIHIRPKVEVKYPAGLSFLDIFSALLKSNMSSNHRNYSLNLLSIITNDSGCIEICFK